MRRLVLRLDAVHDLRRAGMSTPSRYRPRRRDAVAGALRLWLVTGALVGVQLLAYVDGQVWTR